YLQGGAGQPAAWRLQGLLAFWVLPRAKIPAPSPGYWEFWRNIATGAAKTREKAAASGPMFLLVNTQPPPDRRSRQGMKKMTNLNGKIALVTGASSGIGAATGATAVGTGFGASADYRRLVYDELRALIGKAYHA